MPSTKKYINVDSVNLTPDTADSTYEDYEESYEWCYECGAMEPDGGNVICECCIHNANVDKMGIPSFQNSYWMNSCCETGRRLRRSYEIFNNAPLSEDDNAFPPPVICPGDGEKYGLTILNKKRVLVKTLQEKKEQEPDTKIVWGKIVKT